MNVYMSKNISDLVKLKENKKIDLFISYDDNYSFTEPIVRELYGVRINKNKRFNFETPIYFPELPEKELKDLEFTKKN
jgi:hypothetical protein